MCCGCVFSLPRCFGFALGIGGQARFCLSRLVCVILQAPARSSWVCFMLVRKFVQGSPSDSVGVRWPFVFSLLWSVSEAYRSAPVFPIHGVASHVVPSMCRVHSPARAVGKCRGCIAVKKQDSIELGPVIVSSMVMQEIGTGQIQRVKSLGTAMRSLCGSMFVGSGVSWFEWEP